MARKALCLFSFLLLFGSDSFGQPFRFSNNGNIDPWITDAQDFGNATNRWRDIWVNKAHLKGPNEQLMIDADMVGQRSTINFRNQGTNVGHITFRNGTSDAFYVSGYGDLETNSLLIVEQDGDLFLPKGNLYLTNSLYLPGGFIAPETGIQTLVATNRINAAATTMLVEGSGAGVTTLIATPTILPGTNGRIIVISGNHAVNKVRLQSESILNGTLLRLKSDTYDLGLYDHIGLKFSSAHSVWEEIFRSGDVGAVGGGGGTGDVTAASSFGTDNRIIRSDGTGKGVQASGLTLDDSMNLSGVAALNANSVSVIDSVYDATLWNGDSSVPTKNAVRDKIESMGAGGGGDVTAAAAFANDSRVILSDGAGSKGVKSSPVTIDSLGNITGVNNITMTNPFPTGVYSTGVFTNDNRLLRSDGTGRNAQSSNIQLDDNGTITLVANAPLVYPQNTKQTFNPGSTSAGLNVGSLAGIPSAQANGDLWFNSTENALYSINSSSTLPYALSHREDIIFKLNDFRALGSPAPTFTTAEDTDAWLFIDNQDSYLLTQFMAPNSMGNSGASLTVEWIFTMTNAASGNVAWGAQVYCPTTAEDPNNTSNYGPLTLSTNNPVSVAAGIPINGSLSLSGTTADNIGKGKLVKFRFMRDADNAVDTATGNAELLAIRCSWVRKQ